MLLFYLIFGITHTIAGTIERDVAVVVDTSMSMRATNMDQARASLLVSRLLTDIVPGRLAIIRMLDLDDDSNVLVSKTTNKTIPCRENPSVLCTIVEPANPGGWGNLIHQARGAELVRYGVLVRGSDIATFKQRLDRHLAQDVGNSLFGLAFRGAQAFMEDIHSTASTVLWLSDGKPEDPSELTASIDEMKQKNIDVEALVFGAGDRSIPEQLRIPTYTVSDPRTIMLAFAEAFRRIVGAPYQAGGVVNQQPSFEMQRHIHEAWIVVYGDQTLSRAWMTTPVGMEEADDGADSVNLAGSYRVAHVRLPPAGTWTIHLEGGGVGTAYAVIQRIQANLVSTGPQETAAGTDTPLVVSLQGPQGDIISEPELLSELSVTAQIDGVTIPLRDDGLEGDGRAGDGQYSGYHRFPSIGTIPIRFEAINTRIHQSTSIQMRVRQGFSYRGPPLRIDLGSTTEGATVCRPLLLPAPVEGTIPLSVRPVRMLPAQHIIELRSDTATTQGEPPLQVTGITPLQICLSTGSMAPSSVAQGEHWADIHVPGSEPLSSVPIELIWRVDGVPWYRRWARELIGIAALLIAMLMGYGFIWPFRFPLGSGVLLMDRPDTEDPPFYAFKNFKNVRIGWYRHMEAYLYDSFRLDGRRVGGNRDAAVRFRADGRRVMIQSWGGSCVLWQDTDGEWQSMIGEQPGVFGRIYRIEGKNVYFELRRISR